MFGSLTITTTESEFKLDNCIRFTFEREAYTPYTKATGVFLLTKQPNYSAYQVKTIALFINQRRVHLGVADRVKISRKGERWLFTFSSRGLTVLLGQNEPHPGIISDTTLDSLISDNYISSHIDCESDTPTVNYIYVKEKSTVWDAVTAYSLKAVGTFPYIRNENKVAVTAGTGTHSYLSAKITESGEFINTTLMLSKVYMADLEGNYTYVATSGENFGIVRKKYYPLDRQWLSNPDYGLECKLDYSRRGLRGMYLTYIGYDEEQLYDTVTHCEGMSNMKISYVKVEGSKKGLFTTVKCYME